MTPLSWAASVRAGRTSTEEWWRALSDGPRRAQHRQDQGAGGGLPTEQEAPNPHYHPGGCNRDSGLVQAGMAWPSGVPGGPTHIFGPALSSFNQKGIL